MRAAILATLLVVPSLAPPAPPPAAAGDIFDPERWEILAREHRIESYRGREALMLERGTAWLIDEAFGSGIVELDVALPDAQAFAGIRFHEDGSGNHEHFYLRAHLSGLPDATQYTPVFHRVSGWQIYAGEGFNAPAEIVHDRWMHLRLVVAGDRAEVYLDSDEPILVIPRLLHGGRRGRLGIAASGAPARFANVRVRETASPTLLGDAEPTEPAPPATVVDRWAVSPPFPEADLEGRHRLARSDLPAGDWTSLRSGHRGIANLARVTGIEAGRDTVVAAVTLRTGRERVVRARFGFSDRVRVYLNGRLLFAADDGYRTRDYRFLGTIGLYDELHLPLREGANELWLAVSEGFGGWGVVADLPDRAGLTVVPGAGAGEGE